MVNASRVTVQGKQSDTLLEYVKFEWAQLAAFALIAITVIAATIIAAFCVHRGGDLEYQYKFGILVQVHCKNLPR
jgi:hypothetical protein